MRTYSGHSTPKASNELYRQNLMKGSDRPERRVRSADADRLRLRSSLVARRGRAHRRPDRAHRRHARAVRRHRSRKDEHVDDDQRDRRLAARALRRGRRGAGGGRGRATRYHAKRHHQGVPVARNVRVPARAEPAADRRYRPVHGARTSPEWNPINVCSYHLQEAGATPEQEVAYALSTAIAVLDTVRERGLEQAELDQVFGRISFFVNSSIRFVEEVCKQRAFGRLWDRLGKERYGVARSEAQTLPLTASRSTRSG